MTVSVSGVLRISGRMLAGWAISHRRMPADSATFVTIGQAIEFSRNVDSVLIAGQGTVTFAGQAAGLSRTGARTLPAAQGTVVLTGRTAILRRARKMPAAQGTLTLTGQVVTLTEGSPSLWPDATNTGHTGTLTASPGDLTSSSNGQIIQNLNVTGKVTVQHSNVTVRNCQVQWMEIGPSSGLSATNCIVEDCTIVGTGAMERTGIVVAYAPAAMIRRNDISGVEEGVYVAFTGTVRDNWIHDLASPGDPVPEINGITCQGGATNILIEHNTIEGVSASLNFLTDETGVSITDENGESITVDDY